MRSHREVLFDGILQGALLLAVVAAFVQLWATGWGGYPFIGFGAYVLFLVFRCEAVGSDHDLLKQEDFPCTGVCRRTSDD